MLFGITADLKKRKEADLLVLPYWERKSRPKLATPCEDLATLGKIPTLLGDFSGHLCESTLLYSDSTKEKRCLLLGLGKEEKITIESLRRAYANLTKTALSKGVKSINLLLPYVVDLRHLTVKECLRGICEGILLANYKWEQTHDKKETSLLKSVTLVGVLPKELPYVHQLEQVCEGVYLSRDLVNGNADVVTPEYLVKTAHELSKKFPSIKTHILDKPALEKEKMHLLLAVGKGAQYDPALIIAKYRGAPKAKEHIVLVGKGITFDTGGINLKPTGSIENMRDDMSGAATALGTLAAVASLKLKANVTVVVGAAENAIGSKSFKPGDVYSSHSGKTVEIGNTDAEGRLALADALSYTLKHLSPTKIIDLATLTGAMVVALGEEVSGFFSNNQSLAEALMEASSTSGEPLWRLPLYDSYRQLLKSDIADIKNIGGRPAGSITAALFLEEFVGGIAWAHIDIAGTAFSSKENGYIPKGGVGFGVRLLVDYIQKNNF